MAKGSFTADFDYFLPDERIARAPVDPRDSSRLLVVYRGTGVLEHCVFGDLPQFMEAGDALVLNTTRVFNARLIGRRDSGAPAEVLILRELGDNHFEAMVHPGGKLRPGRVVHVSDELHVEILEVTERRTRVVRVRSSLPAWDAIERYGQVPLPPYMQRDAGSDDRERYQTVYARERGSAAAPTAGLHFTDALLHRIRERGILTEEIVLHVGAGTFKPVESDDPAQHVMHEEWYSISESVAHSITRARSNGKRVCAVGTTTLRALESSARDNGKLTAGTDHTRLFIRPPYDFRVVDRLITNFHLPRSTLIMLVAAFAGYDLTMHAYRTAIDAGYRFYSYGDAMLIL